MKLVLPHLAPLVDAVDVEEHGHLRQYRLIEALTCNDKCVPRTCRRFAYLSCLTFNSRHLDRDGLQLEHCRQL